MKKRIFLPLGTLVFAWLFLSPVLALNVTTFQFDNSRSGVNANETLLTPANVNAANFSQIFDVTVDGQIYAQPLYLAGVTIPGQGVHNVVYVATMHDSVYAFDADSLNQTAPLWHTAFLGTNVSSVPQPDVLSYDINPEVGILSTPVIDPTTNTLYCVAKTKETGTGHNHYVFRLHALDVTTGLEKFGGPYTIAENICDNPTAGGFGGYTYVSGPTAVGTSPDNIGGIVYFNALRQNQRPALTLANGNIYVGWGSHGDNEPYHGWFTVYNATTLQPVPNETFITTPDGNEGGIWMGGGGACVDSSGNIFFSTANGDYNGSQNWSMSVVKFAPNSNFTAPTDWFTPTNFQSLSNADLDLGSSGPIFLPDQNQLATPHLMVVGGKEGVFYLLNRDNLGQAEVTVPLQIIDQPDESSASQIYATPVFFNNTLYYNRDGQVVKAVTFANGQFSTTPNESVNALNTRGGGPVISANGTSNGVLWMINNGAPATLLAYNANTLATSGAAPMITYTLPGNGVKFTHPLIINGKVYAGSAVVNGSTATGHLTAFALASSLGLPSTPTQLVGYSTNPESVNLSWTPGTVLPSSYIIERANGVGGTFSQVGTATGSATTYIDRTVTANTEYSYEVIATNSGGNTGPSNVAEVQVANYVTEPGLVAYWPFDEGTGLTAMDVTGNGHTGTLQGEISWEQGLIGNSELGNHGVGNAINNVQVADTPDLRFTVTQSFSVSAWAKPGSLPGHWSAVIEKSRETAGGWYGIYITPSNQWCFRAGNDVGDLTGPTPTLNWQQIVIVQDGLAGTRTLYVDGNPVATGPAEDASGTGLLWIGEGNNPAAEEGFSGSLDDIHLFNRALSAGDIAALPRPAVAFPNGFSTSSPLVLNGTATINGAKLELTSSQNNQAGSAYFAYPVNVQAFTTNFTFQFTNAALPAADGFTFIIQGQGTNALGAGGGDLGYEGIGQSVAVKFDLYNNAGEGVNSTGLYTNGATPFVPATDLTSSGINLHSTTSTFGVQVTYDGTDLTMTITDLTNPSATFTKSYPIADLPAIVGGNTAFIGFTGATGGYDVTTDILSWSYHPGANTTPTFDEGFTGTTDLILNGTATLNGSAIQLTSGQNNQAGSVFYANPVNVQEFTTNFNFQILNPNADGMTFTVQNQGPTALGAGGGSLGYAGIAKSVAVKFDLYNNAGEGINSTGVYLNGTTPFVPATDLTSSGVNLHSGDVFNSQISYDGANLTVTITDTAYPSETFTQTYPLANLPSIIGGDTAYVGFTGATGGLTCTSDILSWSLTPGTVSSPSFGSGFSSSSMMTYNGSAVLNGTSLQMTDGGGNEAGSVFYSIPVNIQSFTTAFSIQMVNPNADGMTFTIQGSSANELGEPGGGLGSANIPDSLSVKFDLYNNAGEGINSTGVYFYGEDPFTPADDLTPSGVNLHNGHVFNVMLTYDGNNLTLTITDASSMVNTFTKVYPIGDLTAIVGGNTAYVGFTGGTGGLTAISQVLSWTYNQGTP